MKTTECSTARLSFTENEFADMLIGAGVPHEYARRYHVTGLDLVKTQVPPDSLHAGGVMTTIVVRLVANPR